MDKEKNLDELFSDKVDEMFELEVGSEEAKTASEVVKNLAAAKVSLVEIDTKREALVETRMASVLEARRSNREFLFNCVKGALGIAGTAAATWLNYKIWSDSLGFEATGTLRNVSTKTAQKALEKSISKFETMKSLE